MIATKLLLICCAALHVSSNLLRSRMNKGNKSTNKIPKNCMGCFLTVGDSGWGHLAKSVYNTQEDGSAILNDSDVYVKQFENDLKELSSSRPKQNRNKLYFDHLEKTSDFWTIKGGDVNELGKVPLKVRPQSEFENHPHRDMIYIANFDFPVELAKKRRGGFSISVPVGPNQKQLELIWNINEFVEVYHDYEFEKIKDFVKSFQTMPDLDYLSHETKVPADVISQWLWFRRICPKFVISQYREISVDKSKEDMKVVNFVIDKAMNYIKEPQSGSIQDQIHAEVLNECGVSVPGEADAIKRFLIRLTSKDLETIYGKEIPSELKKFLINHFI